jgi:hypothetical protein
MHLRIDKLLAALALCCFSIASAAEVPAAVVKAFYSKHIQMHLSGAPSPQQLRVVAPYLSQHLQALLERAWRKHEQDLQLAPDEKPSYAEGDLFTSLFEGPTSFEILSTETLAHEYAVTVRFDHLSNGIHSTWKDVVRVANTQGRLAIVDVEYGGDWDFAPHGTLISALEDGT